ncbi:carbamoyltransferase HypF [Caloramator sp. E03]|uniref:carbamoyltransferase HypF n=1 Tax=Caloramator sp. E03 TaxID=2576307 RepID=UPI001110275C|nr:carbamoyltransferase HypF [Caloramator sp. E03]QCX32611.1 carbamoyltransferase HypF [Caloramator sp. E03]
MDTIRLKINGIVQGVGFRPFIHKLVKNYGIKGWIKNTSNGVVMEIQGEDKCLINFIQEIKQNSPKLALIENVSIRRIKKNNIFNDFKIINSTNDDEKFTLVSPDVSICEDCLKELFDNKNRRYRYPFINCTNCGPRFTIIKDVPYDREKTTMKNFTMCEICNREYKDIEDRRYHAQPNCCFNCGPKLFFKDKNGKVYYENPIEISIKFLKEGKIIAIKGIGGFHLACNALNDEIVNKLRYKKHRDEKPFALMCKDVQTIRKWCFVNEYEENMLKSFRRPIVLLKKKFKESFKSVSIDNNYLGVMLPYTPVHYLILNEDIDTLVMTSANISDLPIVYKNDEAIEKLSSIVDGFLMNDRDIYTRCDDSVIREFEGKEYPIRRSRGYVPFPIKLNKEVGKVLACGAEQKASFALSRGHYVFLSQHIGDMKNMEILQYYQEQIKHFENLFNIKPEKIACDLHPDYISTEYALNRAKEDKIPLCFIQHHHAHLASCIADNNIDKEVIGVIWDGTGYGTDGTIWGGEFLKGSYIGFERLGTIKPIHIVGGDKAIKEIYRVGYSVLYETYNKIPEDFKFNEDIFIIEKMLKKGINAPLASSIGRLFDAVASIINIKQIVSYEGQGAVLVESLAEKTNEYYEYKIENINGIFQFDWTVVIDQIVSDIKKSISKGLICSKFMNTLAKVSADIVEKIGSVTGIEDVVLSGGVFQNMYLLPKVKGCIEKKGFKVYCHNRVSTNDEGISLGQCLIAYYGGEVKCV